MLILCYQHIFLNTCHLLNGRASVKKAHSSLRYQGYHFLTDTSNNIYAVIFADKQNDSHFQFLTARELETLREAYKVPSTERNTQWSMCNWQKAHTKAKLETCPDDLLCSTDLAALSESLSLFAAEMRNAKRKPYISIYKLLSGLLRYMQTANPEALNFLDKRDKQFAALHNSLDIIFQRLYTQNVGASVKHAVVFTKEEEQAL